MRYATALYDAPLPALAALAALQRSGVSPGDIVVMPHAPELPLAAWCSGPDRGQPAHWMRSLGISAAAADAYAEGLSRGAILLVVRCPTISAPPVAAIVRTLALDLRRAALRWAADPDLRYDWSNWTAPTIAPADSVDRVREDPSESA